MEKMFGDKITGADDIKQRNKESLTKISTIFQHLPPLKHRRYTTLSRLEQLTQLYLTSPPTRSVTALIWCLLTMCVSLAERFRENYKTPCSNIGLTFAGSTAYMIISIVSLICHVMGQGLPTMAVILFGIFGGIIHIFAGADALQFRDDVRWAAVFSIVSGFMLLLDACVTIVSNSLARKYGRYADWTLQKKLPKTLKKPFHMRLLSEDRLKYKTESL